MAFAKAPRLGGDDNIFANRGGKETVLLCIVVAFWCKSVTVRSGATSKTNDMKGDSRITCKGKISSDKCEEFVKVTRKALADISNVGGKTLRIPTPCGSSTKISVRPARVLDNSLKIHTKEHEIKRTSKVGNNRIYKTGQKFIDNKILSLGTTAGGTRKSLPVVKRTSLTDQSLNKENVSSSLDSKQLGQGPASKVSNKAIPQLSSGRYSWKTRTSVGSILSDRNSQNKNNVCIARKSVKKTVKTSRRNSSAPKKPPVVRSKSRSISSTPSEEAASALPLPEKVETKGLKEDTQGESPSYDKAGPTTKVLDVTDKPKPERRKSFTSLLVSGSKFDEKNGDTAQPEKLPSIDDESNELEVAEYVEDIYQFYWVAEALNPAIGCYLSAQTEVTPILRGIMISRLMEVHLTFHLMHETLFLTMDLLDRYLSQVTIKKNELQLVGVTALLLASKYEDYWHPRIEDLISISPYTRDQILGMERIMLKQLNFRLNAPTPYVFMLRFLKAAQSNKKLEQLAFYLIELTLVEYEALKFKPSLKPSLLCTSAVYVARCTVHLTPAWTSLLKKHTHYNVQEMRECSDMISKFHKAAKTGKLTVVYEKYMNPDRSNVAVLTPLDKLPRAKLIQRRERHVPSRWKELAVRRK
ncbi:unnamed protein product [Cochlearia groenlandica]